MSTLTTQPAPPPAPSSPASPTPPTPPGALGPRRSASSINGEASLPTVNLRGVTFHSVTARQAIDHILDELDVGRGGVVITPNLDHLRRVGDDLHFGAMVSEADLVVADGMPLIWASRVQGTPLPERVAGSDLISTLSEAAANAGRSIFLLGGEAGTAEGAADVLKRRYPRLKVAGTFYPEFGFEDDPAQMAQLVDALRAAQPDIVFVGLGSPKQERVVDLIRGNLPDAWWLGVGVSFSFLCGRVQRAPRWMQKTGTEWLHRVVQEPGRLFKRYFVHGLPFAAVLMQDAVMRRLGVSASPTLGGMFPRPRAYASQPPRPLGRPAHGEAAEAAPRAGSGTRAWGAVGASGDRLAPRLEQVRRVGRTAAPANVDALATLERLRCVVLLSGKLRRDAFAAAIDRAVLDLPIEHRTARGEPDSGEVRTFLDHWVDSVAKLAGHVSLPSLPLHVSVDTYGPSLDDEALERRGVAGQLGVPVDVGVDDGEYRGTAGVLSDLARRRGYDDDDLILVANAGQLLLDPLAALARALAVKRADVAIAGHEDGTPSGLMLVRVATLRDVPEVGYHDMKEQHLPAIAGRFDVKVLSCRRPTALPVRSLSDYIAALRLYHAPTAARHGDVDPLDDGLGEHHRRRFSVVEPGAEVAGDVYLHDSVVLAGARVGRGANLVRSVIGPGGVVAAGRDVMDAILPERRAGAKGTSLKGASL